MCRLRLALLLCCGCMLLLIFIFAWHPLKEKIPGKQVSRGLLSWDLEVIPIYSETKVVVVDGCWMKSLGEIKFRLFRWWRWLNSFLSNSRGGLLRFRYCWWHCKHFIFITGIICIKSTFRAVTCDVFHFTFWKSERF